jgi:CheY-like chemotaxis protein
MNTAANHVGAIGDEVESGLAERVINVLIVDDSGACRNMTQRSMHVIVREGCRICCDQASDGRKALEMVKMNMNVDTSSSYDCSTSISSKFKMSAQSVYDLILMDYQMPKMDGPTAVKRIRALGFSGRIVGLTGNVLGSEIDVMKNAGADSILSKPVQLTDLEALICEL